MYIYITSTSIVSYYLYPGPSQGESLVRTVCRCVKYSVFLSVKMKSTKVQTLGAVT